VGGREDENKRMVKIDYIFSFEIGLLGHMFKKINTFIVWCMVIPLDPHSVYT
jgi:hypothetical protein